MSLSVTGQLRGVGMASSEEELCSPAWIARNYGVIVPSAKLALLLGYPNVAALRQARSAGRLPIRLFRISGRRGLFADAKDVGDYLRESRSASQRKGG